MPARSVRLAAGFGLALVALHALGFFAPTVFTWGIHAFGFLPASVFGLYLLAAVLGIRAAVRGKLDGLLERLGGALERRPWAVWATAFACLVALAFVFRVRVPLLGDSFIAVKLYENRLAHGVFNPTAHEFLSFAYFYAVMKLLGTTTYPAMANAFLAGELVLGAAFLGAALAAVRLAVDGTSRKGAALLVITCLPCLQLFFGYVENYAVVLTLLAVYALCALLCLKGRFPFALLPLVFAALFLAHYLNAPLGLSLIYLGWREIRERGWKQIGLAAGLAAAIALLAWLTFGSGLRVLVPPERHSPLLSATRIANVYQAYTLFSPLHAVDLANLLLLLAPCPVLALAVAWREGGAAAVFASPVARLIAWMLAPMALVFLLLQFDLPVALDWDIPSSYVYLAALLAAAAALPSLGAAGPRVTAVLLVPTILGSLGWWTLNATVEPAIARAKIFLDPRISSADGYYQSTLHLTEWYVRQHDDASIRELSENYLRMYPDDSRGYANYTLYLMEFGKEMEPKIREVFDRWLARDPRNHDARNQYAHFELDVGQRAYRERRPLDAIGHLEKSFALDPSISDASNSVGLAFKALGNADSARSWFLRTIALDPANAPAYINLGNLSDDLGSPSDAVGWYEKALAVAPGFPAALYNLGITYAKLGDTAKAHAALRKAAQGGMQDAADYLQQRGIRW